MYNSTNIKYLYHTEKNALFRTIDADTSRYRIRNRAIFYLAEYAALRAGEIGLLKMSEINILKKEIYFRRLKGSCNNTLRIIDKNVFSALTEYLSWRESSMIRSEYVFISQKNLPISRKTLHDLMRNYCFQAGLPPEKSHFHVLKHTRAVSLGNAGLDIREIQYWLGHKNATNTEIYMQFTSVQHEALYRKILNSTAL